MANEMLACAYDSIEPAKALRLRQCSSMLTFAEYSDGRKKLVGMNSCRVRLCPICSWRRSLKCYHNTERIMRRIDSTGEYGYIFLTLTLRNCVARELSHTLDVILQGWNRVMQTKRLKQAVKGWYRGLEVTHDTDELISAERYKRAKSYYDSRGLRVGDRNPGFDTYHPHLHVVLVVRKSYFSSRYYISKAEYAAAWQHALRVDYAPQVDVRKVKGDLRSAVAEISKYAAKASDYIVPEDWDLTLDSVRVLDAALTHRRLIAYGGIMREAFRELRLEDVETGNLVDVGDEQPSGDEYRLVSYFWHSGYRQYFATGDVF